MTRLLERHGGPSALHECRAATLVTIAALTGHVLPLDALPDGSIPDALRLRPTDGSLFVGDAKATETPGNAATLGRLDRYARALARWARARGPGVLALAVTDSDADGWMQALRDLCQPPPRGIQVDGHVDHLETGTAVVWQSYAWTSTSPPAGDPSDESRATASGGRSPVDRSGA